MRGKKSKVVSCIAVIAVLLAVALAAGLILKYTNVRDKVDDIINPALCVEYNGKRYTGEDNVLSFASNGKMRFEVKNSNGYTVDIKPNVTDKTDFTYTVNDKIYPYSGEDLTSVIVGKSVYKTYFEIDCSQSLDLADVLSRVWGGKEVTLNGEVRCPYLLTVTSSSGEIVSISLFVGLPTIILLEQIIF